MKIIAAAQASGTCRFRSTTPVCLSKTPASPEPDRASDASGASAPRAVAARMCANIIIIIIIIIRSSSSSSSSCCSSRNHPGPPRAAAASRSTHACWRPPLRERGSAPKGVRRSTIFVDPRWKLCLSSAHPCSGSLMVWQSSPKSGS